MHAISRRTTTVAIAILAAIALIAIPAPREAGAGAIQFGKAQYDSPGADTGTNYSVNQEWIRIKNTSTTKRNLTGWTVRDASGHVYRFGTFYLAAGATVTLYSGKGTNTASKRFWGSNFYIWNNTGDKATLKNSSGSIVDTCSWGDGVGYKTC